MPESKPNFPEVDRIIHEPARLAILTVLLEARSWRRLTSPGQAATGLSKGNLSVQLTRLDEAGLISIEKTLFRKTTRTTVKLTKPGKEQLSEYWRTMKKIQEQGGRRVP